MRLAACCCLLLLATQVGCALMLTEAVVSTPRRLSLLRDARLPIPPQAFGFRDRFSVPIPGGREAIEISVAVMDPERVEEPKATILVLHGIRAQGVWMLDIADALADDGYRVVVADLRGHGGSTGATLTFGVGEARDLSHVIDELEARGLLVGKLGVFGHSYGASTAIHLAALDPRVSTVVATAPFAEMREEVPHYVRTMLPGVGHLLSDDFYRRIVDDAGRRGGFDPDDASASVAASQTNAPILLLHGLEDIVVPPVNSQRIYQGAPSGSKLVYLRDLGHFGVWLDIDGRVKKHTLAWFEERLARNVVE
jgi:pimeloyl-ACP methyl ester carboxylesterase